ncbi:hypothetical protein Tco_0662306 [Tanacetum coccineum]
MKNLSTEYLPTVLNNREPSGISEYTKSIMLLLLGKIPQRRNEVRATLQRPTELENISEGGFKEMKGTGVTQGSSTAPDLTQRMISPGNHSDVSSR